MTAADINAIAWKTLDMPNAPAWREILRLLNGRVSSAAITSVRTRVWKARKVLKRANAKPAGHENLSKPMDQPGRPFLSTPSWARRYDTKIGFRNLSKPETAAGKQ
jgi:hypothetical protein